MAFNQVKTTQIATWLMARCGNPMDVLKLMKLLYLADRLALSRYGFTMTGDRMVSMPHGPVLSQTLDLINGAGPTAQNGWDAKIADRAGRRISLRDGVQSDRDALDELSDTDVALLEQIAGEFGSMSAWDLREYTHKHCPEWVDPNGSSQPIRYEDVYKAIGVEPELGSKYSAHIQADDQVDRIFASL